MLKPRTLLPLIALLAACNSGTGASAQPGMAGPFKVEVMADLDSPWAMTFLPDGRMLITEKQGQLLLVSKDGVSRKVVSGTPAVSSEGQGALMDVVLHPKFKQNRLVYFSFSEENADGLKGVALARGTLVDGDSPSLKDVQVIFRAHPYVEGDGHFSGRIAFAPDGHLFFTNGERQKFTPAQDPAVTLGKVLRLNDDGTPAAGNPLAAKGFDPAIWSYGHRNLLGISFDAKGNLWEIEMGPKGGDEINLIQPGLNYGWPKASNGDNYDNTPIPDHAPGDGFEPPKVFWNPSISPGDMMIYSGRMWPQWRGDLFVAALSGQALIRVHLDGTNATKGDQWAMGARIREVEEGPDGAIWLLEDGGGSPGRLLRLTPAK
ncbi:PQQ-dependent sugar dehydrogenase [Sphingomonas sp. LB-2]|uniref:PQQ-dependent sugar dehydrogenase n=1 Tax=Sphingomonas caeni TaxID=2984949 RepID=UPI002231C66D|nr:PQQ-dependent sugar dehydrogenase [Sphingomonas caeni]MCW3847009.1 PQQ-dependent sugar dehydrogenase [Sphingomonas caeni]